MIPTLLSQRFAVEPNAHKSRFQNVVWPGQILVLSRVSIFHLIVSASICLKGNKVIFNRLWPNHSTILLY